MKAAPAAALAALCLHAATAWSAPITFNTALPVHQGGYVLREQMVFMDSADDRTPAARDMDVRALVSVLGYGVSRDFALFGMLPWFDKRLDLRMGTQNVARREQGLGDLVVLGRFTAYTDDAPGRALRIAPFLGVKVPTGADRARDAMGRLPPQLQPGSGSWDALGGAVLTWQTLDFQVDAQAGYRANSRADGFRAGNVWQVDGSLQYRLWPRRLGAGVPAFFYGVLETNLVHAAQDRIAGTDDVNSGGTTWFVTPGLQYVTRRWIVEAGVQIPLSRRRNGSALGSGRVVTTGLRLNF